jgi:hypothetical protein
MVVSRTTQSSCSISPPAPGVLWEIGVSRVLSGSGLKVSHAYWLAVTWDKLKSLASVHFDKVHQDCSQVFGYGSWSYLDPQLTNYGITCRYMSRMATVGKILWPPA